LKDLQVHYTSVISSYFFPIPSILGTRWCKCTKYCQ